MPVIFRHKGIRIFFYSNEGTPREPMHVHAQHGESLAKIWMRPEGAVTENYGFSSTEMTDLVRVLQENATLIERTWDEYFG